MAKRRYENGGNLLKRALILGDNGEHSVFAMIG